MRNDRAEAAKFYSPGKKTKCNIFKIIIVTQSCKLQPCAGCGALVPDTDGPTHKYIGASPGCWAIYGEVLAKEYSDVAYYSAHQLTVDAYAAQHPGTPSRQSIQSVAVHLVSLYGLLERGFDFAQAVEVKKHLTKRLDQLVWLEPPTSLGEITVLDVVKAKDAAEHRKIVEEWASSVWRAWSPHHDTVRRWARLS